MRNKVSYRKLDTTYPILYTKKVKEMQMFKKFWVYIESRKDKKYLKKHGHTTLLDYALDYEVRRG